MTYLVGSDKPEGRCVLVLHVAGAYLPYRLKCLLDMVCRGKLRLDVGRTFPVLQSLPDDGEEYGYGDDP